MARGLLIRGMLAGLLAAVIAVLFARGFAEPPIDLAIGFEAAHEAAAHAMAEPEVVSRATQKGIGLLTAVALYGAAMGGIFALVFTIAYGRIARAGPRTLSLLLALAAFVAIAVCPALKYPPNPPAVGLHDTVGIRTITYFVLLACSIASMVVAVRIGRQIGSVDGLLGGAGAYVALMAGAFVLLPTIDEVPADFPATVLWNFRVAAIATQAVLWSAIGIGFGSLADRFIRATAAAR